MFICVAYQFSASATRLYYHVSLCLSTTFFNFFRFVFALSKKALKTYLFQLLCYCRVQQPWIIYPLKQQKSTLFLKLFPKRHFDQNAYFFYFFLCILYIFIQLIHFLNKSFPNKSLQHKRDAAPATSLILSLLFI